MPESLKTYISKKSKIHLIGIGGVSMSALGELLASKGVPVTGSDRQSSDTTKKLEGLGITIVYAHLPENVGGAALVIRTAAVHDDNPEIVRAHELGIPVMERAEAWGELMLDYENVICLAGTHGKTTTTSMMTMIAIEAALDPTVMVGSHLPAIDGTLRVGGNKYFVAESCEYCNSFLKFHPTVAVVLNVEEDHLDFFSGIDDIIASFHSFCALTPQTGLLVLNGDDENALRCAQGLERTIYTFGTTAQSRVFAENITDENGYFRFDVRVDGVHYARVALSVPGYHNMMNALACCAVSHFMGVSGEAAAQGLARFTGSSRRFQKIGTMACGACVVDDYAHHPSEMKATFAAAQKMNFDRILCVFQPHTFSRTKALFPDFIDALKDCDAVVLAPIYAAREQNRSGVSSRDLEKALPNAVALQEFDEIEAYLRKHARRGDLVLTMGAGNINEIAYSIVE